MLHLDLTIGLDNAEELQEGALEVLRHIRPDWPAQSIRWKHFNEGITNKLLGGWCGEDRTNMVLIRVYGLGTEAIIDRAAELANMQQLAQLGEGSQLYASFTNGIAYEFVPGQLLTQDMTQDPAIYRCVALGLARLHSLPLATTITSTTSSRKVVLWDRMDQFIRLVPDSFSDPVKQEKFVQGYMSKTDLLREAAALKCRLEQTASPVVFCHNDALLANIVYQEDKDKVVFIDLEYGGLAPAAFDIANHMCEFVGCEGELDYETWFPSRSYQLDWLAIYLKEFNRRQNIEPPTLSQIEEVYSIVQEFTLCAHLLWSAWAMIQESTSNIDFDFLNYGIQRLREFRRRKSILGL